MENVQQGKRKNGKCTTGKRKKIPAMEKDRKCPTGKSMTWKMHTRKMMEFTTTRK